MEYSPELLNELLLTQYKKNLEFLQQNHKEIFDNVNNLSNRIEKNIQKEKYSLEFIEEQGYFDIYDLENEKFIYGFNSYHEAEKRKEHVDFSQKNSLNLLRVDPNTNKLAQMGTLGEINPLVSFLNNKIDFKRIEFEKIFKFVFIGVGAGVHVNEIYKKVDSLNTLIIEPNLEIFRLSLFLLDFTIFEEGTKKLFLSVGSSKFERESVFEEFEHYHNYMNYNIKHHLFSLEYENILHDMINYFSHNFALSFSYNSTLNVLSRTLNFMNSEYKFLQKELLHKNPILKDKKVLIISAGPSIDEKIEWIYKNQDKFIIVCVDIILKKLEKNNIIPDIVVSIDPSHLVANFFDTEDKNFLKNSSIIFLSQQHEDVIEKVKNLNIYFSQVLPISDKLGYHFSVPNVGTFSFAITLFLGGNELYLIGSDAAFNQKTGSRYAKDNSRTVMDKLEPEKNGNISDQDIFEVKGNLKDSIKTNRELLRFKKDYETFIYTYKKTSNKEFKAFNLSNGVYIEGLTPLDTKDIDTDSIDVKSFNNKKVDNISTIVDDLEIHKDKKLLVTMIGRVKKFQKLKVKSKDHFLQEKLDLMIWILEKKKEMSNKTYGNIFLRFIELIDIYINFALNIRQPQLHSKETLRMFKSYWCDCLLSLLKKMNKMIDSLEK